MGQDKRFADKTLEQPQMLSESLEVEKRGHSGLIPALLVPGDVQTLGSLVLGPRVSGLGGRVSNPSSPVGPGSDSGFTRGHGDRPLKGVLTRKSAIFISCFL